MAEGSVSAILKSNDVTRTIEWYRRMGFEIRGVFPESGEPTWCEVARDGVILQFLEPIYGWDDEVQRRYHGEWFDPSRLSIIEDDEGKAVGVVDVGDEGDHLCLSRIEVRLKHKVADSAVPSSAAC